MRRHVLDKPCLYKCTLKLARTLPSPLLYGTARFAGALAFAFSAKDRRNIGDNLKRVFNGDCPSPDRRRLIWKIFQNYSIYMVDFFRLLGMDLDETPAFAQLYEGRSNLDEAMDRGRGVLLLTAHLGHWEIGGLGLRALGYPVNVVTVKHNSPFMNSLVTTLRNRPAFASSNWGIRPTTGLRS